MTTSPVRVLVCGGRDFADTSFMTQTLDRLHHQRPFSLLMHGGQRGADKMAGQWALTAGVPVQVYEVTKADWNRYGSAAGPIRNRRMLIDGDPQLVVAFTGGSGTADMMNQARRAGVQVVQPGLVTQ